MHRSPAARWRAIALLAAIVGAGASAYLLVEYVTGQPGLCLTGSGCDLVRASDFAYPLGIPLPLFGLVFYVVAAWLVLRTVASPTLVGVPSMTVLAVAAAAGAAASMLLTGIELFVIRAFCSWCLVQAGASLVLLGAALALSRSDGGVEAEAHSSRVRQQLARAADEDRAGLRRTGLLGGGATALVVALLLVGGAVGGAAVGPSDGSSLAPAGSPRLGTGAVEVVEFADFQCPGCAMVAPLLAQLARANEMTLVSRYFPLDGIHANADAAARAAAAAHLQDSFWEMSEAIYASQSAWKDLAPAAADAFFAGLADQLALDVTAWQAAYASSEVFETVDADRHAARDLHVNSTPTLFIGGKLYAGSMSIEEIRAALLRASPGA
ncbi:MAG: thioredoxin domain-containing protein [Chloroflexota bacterium]|nr:thioredoxin domain-containing protein [Chloroflexota bacterium]